MTKKIIDLINNTSTITPAANNGDNGKRQPYISLEYFPPRTEEGVKNLKARMDRMKNAVQPIFSDITWGAGGSTSDLSMDIAKYLQQTGHVANLHMTCTNIADSKDPVDDIRNALLEAKKHNISNIVALRGDPPAGETEWKQTDGGFACALDLVQFIRKEFGDSFGISVAGYPEGHPNAITEIDDPTKLTNTEKARSSTSGGKTYTCLDDDYEKELVYLKQKVDAGADFIITQMFFDVHVYHQFVADCRKIGILCPIIPGLMCITNYNGFRKMTGFCKTRVPEFLSEKMESLKDSPDEIKAYGIEFGAQVCKELMESSDPPKALHYYTLNLEKVVYGVLQKLGYMKETTTAKDADETSQVAAGSAWARVGDTVSSIYGSGKVSEMDTATGTAKILLDSWTLANQQQPTAILQKGHYKKVF